MLVWICRFPLPLGVWEGLGFVIVAVSGLFSYLLSLRGDLFYVLPCVVLFLHFFSPISIAITSLGEERANLSAYVHLFDLRLFGFVCSSSSSCLGWAAACACDTLWTFLLTSFTISVSVCL